MLRGDEFEDLVRVGEGGTKGRVKFNPTDDVDVDSITDTFLTQVKRVLDFSKWPADRLPRGLTDQLDKTLGAAIREGKKLRIVFAEAPPQKYLDRLGKSILASQLISSQPLDSKANANGRNALSRSDV